VASNDRDQAGAGDEQNRQHDRSGEAQILRTPTDEDSPDRVDASETFRVESGGEGQNLEDEQNRERRLGPERPRDRRERRRRRGNGRDAATPQVGQRDTKTAVAARKARTPAELDRDPRTRAVTSSEWKELGHSTYSGVITIGRSGLPPAVL
jgi:hypothetical protein